MRLLVLAACCVASGAALPDAAHAVQEGPKLAYVDPGAGSFVLQAVIALFAGAIVAVNAYWTRIKRFLGMASDDGDTTGGPSRDD